MYAFSLRNVLPTLTADAPQIFDFINVQNTHNATYAQQLPPTFLEQARALANWHEYNVFTDPTFSGLGNSEYHRDC